MIFPGFPGVLSFFQVFQVFQVEWEPWGMHGGGCVWQGACMAGGMHGGGCAWLGACVAGACMAGETATAADGMHPTGMHSCLKISISFAGCTKNCL